MACIGNMPSFKYVTVESLVITYNGTPYPIKTFITNKKYIVWNIDRPYQLEDTNVRPESSLLEYLIVINDKGKPTIVEHDELWYSFNQTTNGSNLTSSSEYNALKTEVGETTKKFNLLSNTVNGMTQIIGSTEELEDGSIIYNLNKVKFDSKSYGISIGEIETKIDDKYAEIKPIILNDLIEYLRSVSEYKLSFTNILEDTLITTEELELINTNKTNITDKSTKLQSTLSDLKVITDSVENVEQSQMVVDIKNKLITLHTVLISMCDSYLQDSKISGEEKTNIIQKVYELVTYIGTVQNTCNNITVNGQAGVVYSIENELLMLKDKTTSSIKELDRSNGLLTEKYSKIEQDVGSISITVSKQSSGGVNLIPNPTANLNLDGWGDTGNCKISRYVKTGDVYIPQNPTPPNVQSDDIFQPELHLIEPYGGGLAMLLKDCSGKIIFFDGGYSQNAQHCINYIESLGVTRINYYIITHFHSDHAECSAEILNHFDADYVMFKSVVRGTLTSEEEGWGTYDIHDTFKNMCVEKEVKILDPRINTYIKLSEFSNLKTVNTDSNNYANYNHQSLMFLYTYKNNKIFLAGDGTHDASLSALGQIGKVDIMQMGHHGDGSIGGSSQQLIDELKPKHAYFASDFLATGMPYMSNLTLMRVSWHYGLSYSHGAGFNGDFKFILDGNNVTTTGIDTRANNCWYERVVGTYFYFKANGLLAQNEWLNINGYQYYFGADYVMFKNKWKQDNTGTWFYLKDDGKMAVNETINVNGKDYIFDHNGACINP